MKKYIKSSQYIKATYSQSMPDWFKKRFGHIRYKLDSKYRSKPIKWDTIQFYDENPNGTYKPVYLLDLGYDGEIYIPGVNDDEWCSINGKGTHLGTLYKKPRKFNEFVIDTKYIDLSDDSAYRSNRERYQDPRYEYDYNHHMKYQGQQKQKSYYGNGYKWTEGYGRDKSGYRIPSPSQMLSRYYSEFPRAVFKKIDTVYQRILNLRDEISELKVSDDYLESIGTEPIYRENRPREIKYSDIGKVFREFDYIVESYKEMLDEAAGHKNNIDRFEQELDSYSEGQRLSGYDTLGYYGQSLNNTIKILNRNIDSLENTIDNLKEY